MKFLQKELLEIELRILLKKSKRGIRTNYKGRIAEYYVKLWLESQDYIVEEGTDLKHRLRGWGDSLLHDFRHELRTLQQKEPPEEFGTINLRTLFNEGDQLLQQFVDWGTYRKEMIPIVEDKIQEILNSREEAKNLRKKWGEEFAEKLSKIYYQPDLIALKAGKPYIVEVKSSRKGEVYWYGEQEEKFHKLNGMGFNTMLISVPITINIDIQIEQPNIEKIIESK